MKSDRSNGTNGANRRKPHKDSAKPKTSAANNGRQLALAANSKGSNTNASKITRRGGGPRGISGKTAGVRVMTPRERRVMEVLLQASSEIRTNRQMAEDAGVPYRTFVRIKADPWFRQQWQKRIDDRLQALVPQVVDLAFKNAHEVGRDGHYDRRMLLTMAGLQTTASKGEGGNVNVTLNISDRLTSAIARKEEALQRIERQDDDEPGGPVVDADYEEVSGE